MSSEHDFLKRHPFELHATQIENPIEDYARHIRAFDVGEVDSPGVPFDQIAEEMPYSDREIEADLEYLTTARFVERELTEDGRRAYSLTEEADTYLEEFRGKTGIYTDNVDEVIRGEF